MVGLFNMNDRSMSHGPFLIQLSKERFEVAKHQPAFTKQNSDLGHPIVTPILE